MPPVQRAPLPRNPAVDFFRGVHDVWRGFGLLASRPGLWIWAAIPFVLNVLFFALIGWGGWHLAGGWLEGHFPAGHGFWTSLAGWLLTALFWVVLALTVVFSFVPLATLIASPFNDILSEKVEKIYRGMAVQERFSLRALLRAIAIGIRVSLRLTLVTLGLLAAALLLYFVPGVGPMLFSLVSAAITIRFLSLQFTAYSMDRRFYSYDQRREFLRRHRARTIGLGAMAFLIMLVPVLNALFIPVSAVAGTLLFCDAQPDPARRL